MDVPHATIALFMLAQSVTRALSRFGLDHRGIDPHPRQPVRVLKYRQGEEDGLRHAALKGLRPKKKRGVIRRSPVT